MSFKPGIEPKIGSRTEPRTIEDCRLVRIAGNRFGRELDGHMLLRSSDLSPESGIMEIYFRTSSGNVYLLERGGTLTNALRSAQRGEARSIKVEWGGPSVRSLMVGQFFEYLCAGRDLWTTPVTEAVAVYSRRRSSIMGHVRQVEGYNRIAEEFERISGLPQTRT